MAETSGKVGAVYMQTGAANDITGEALGTGDETVFNTANVNVDEDSVVVYMDATELDRSLYTVTVDGTITFAAAPGAGGNAITGDYNYVHDTLTKLVAAITALDKGWVVNIEGNGSAYSTDLVVIEATSCFESAEELTLGYIDNWTIEQLIDQVTDELEQRCNRQFKSRVYTKERYDGRDDGQIWLNQFPVTALTRVSTGTIRVATITNTSSDGYDAYMIVDSDSVTLVVVGGTNEGSNDLTFAANATMTALEIAINDLGKGWSCSVTTNHGDTPTSQLLETAGGGCLCVAAPVYIPQKRETDFKLYSTTGKLVLTGSVDGYQNVIVDYTAGYITVPDALRMLALQVLAYCYARRNHNPVTSRERVGILAFDFRADKMTEWQRETLEKFKRHTVCGL